jgi:hypothetical protein
MDSPAVLELGSLLVRNPPVGEALLDEFGAAAVVRLGFDPQNQLGGAKRRVVLVDWRPEGSDQSRPRQYVVDWTNLPQGCERRAERLHCVLDADRITEGAAICLMALFINELEGAFPQSVIPAGQGGDYLVEWSGRIDMVHVEVSGILEDTSPTGSRAKQRLTEKRKQLLRTQPAGFVSVTTFYLGTCDGLHSYLHHVTGG